MAKLPTIAELIANPALWESLTIPQLNEFNRQLQLLVQIGTSHHTVPNDVMSFAAKFSHGRFKVANWHRYLGHHLTALNSGGPNLLISAPPRHGKSWSVSKWTPTWFLAKNPQKRVILASYESTFAEIWGRAVRNNIDEFGAEIGLSLDEASRAASRFDLVSGGGMMTAGAGGPILGKGADLFIIDDPIKNEKDAASQAFRDSLWDWFLTVVLSRLEPNARIVLMAQRWHEDDLHGRIMAEMRKNPNFLYFEEVRLSALAEENDPMGREVGEPLWPERYSREDLERIRSTTTPYFWSALYQQNPTPEEGNLIHRQWWQYYDSPPDEFDQEILSFDLAFTTSKTSDYTVGFHLARKGSSIFILDRIRGQFDPAESMQAIKNMAALHPKANAKLIERTGSSETHYILLQREVPGLIPIKPGTTSKLARTRMIVPFIQAGNIHLPRNAPWLAEFIEECAQFPNALHDDQVDAATQGIAFLMHGVQAFNSQSARTSLTLNPPKTGEELMQRQFSTYVHKVINRVDRKWRVAQRIGVPFSDL